MPRVLIVDDDESIRCVLSDMVRSAGPYQTDIAMDGLDGLRKVRHDEYDIIFTDIKMPRMGGLEFMQEVRKQDPMIPVVVITAYSYLETAVSAMKQGAADFITKPFTFNDIRHILSKVIRERELIKSFACNGNKDAVVEALNSELYKRLQEINTLFTLSIELDEIKENSGIFSRIVSMVARLLKAKRVALGLIENGIIENRYTIGFAHVQKLVLGGSVYEDVMRSKRHVVLEVGQESPLNGYPLESEFLIIPLVLNNEVLGFLSVTDKTDGYKFADEEINLALTLAHKACLRLENNALYEITYNNLINTLKTLILTVEARDSYTKQHSERVTKLSLEIADAMGCAQAEMDAIRFAGYLHDIGKIGVRDIVLLKPGGLTEEEFEEIKKHPVVGDNIVSPLGSFPLERLLIRHHHERFDGRGYPDGLEGEDIPLIARILAVADTYDSMTTTRPYRRGVDHRTAIGEIQRCSSTQFDPVVVRAFMTTATGRGGKFNEN
ncbi:MAG TPA: response regulator [Nitrospirae bacterium]|nr:response regulator [Nitrospirota bacterium]